NLGDKGGCVDRQRENESGEFRQNFDAAAYVEATHLRSAKAERKARQRKGGERQSADEAEHRPKNPDLRAGALAAPARPVSQHERGGDSSKQCDENSAEMRGGFRPGEEQAAIVEDAAAGEPDA